MIGKGWQTTVEELTKVTPNTVQRKALLSGWAQYRSSLVGLQGHATLQITASVPRKVSR